MSAPSKTEWRSIDWLPGYEISDDGQIRFAIIGWLEKGFGYRRVSLKTPSGKRTFKVHRLVCEAFHGPPPSNSHVVAHYDGNPSNNRADNLRWATMRENVEDRTRHGRTPSGESHPNAALTRKQVIEIRERFTGEIGEVARIAREYGVSAGTISHIRNGRSWNGA